MIADTENLLRTLAAAEPPALGERFAARTLARASAHLPRRRPAEGRAFDLGLPAPLVPALLASAALVLAVDTCVRVARLFGGS
jgi:hypothetical protein